MRCTLAPLSLGFVLLCGCSVVAVPHPPSNTQSAPQAASAALLPEKPLQGLIPANAPGLRVQILDRAAGTSTRFVLPGDRTSSARLTNGAEISVEVRSGSSVIPLSLDTGSAAIALRRTGAGVWSAGFQYWNFANDPDVQATLAINGVTRGKPFQAVIPVKVVHDP